MENQIRIVVTKKLLPNQKQFLLNANFSVIEADFIDVKSKDFKIEKDFEFLIFTSQNAVDSVLKNKKIKNLLPKKCFCVGEKTKAALEEKGFIVLIGSDYAAELASIICNQYAKQSFTFFSGNLRRDILPQAMQLAQIQFEEIEVYETIVTPKPISSTPDGILFFSPSAVESYLKANSITNEMCFCIGKTTAEAVESITKNTIIANQPTVENVIIQCINYYKKQA
jgi:uroporphyrinogen-III synthase